MAYHPFYSSFSPPPPSTIPPTSPNPYGYEYSNHYNHEQQPPLPYSQPQPPPPYSPTSCFSHGYTPPSPNQYTSSSNPYTPLANLYSPLASLYSQFQLPPSSPPLYSPPLPFHSTDTPPPNPIEPVSSGSYVGSASYSNTYYNPPNYYQNSNVYGTPATVWNNYSSFSSNPYTNSFPDSNSSCSSHAANLPPTKPPESDTFIGRKGLLRVAELSFARSLAVSPLPKSPDLSLPRDDSAMSSPPQPSKVSVSPFPLGVDDSGQITSPPKPQVRFEQIGTKATTPQESWANHKSTEDYMKPTNPSFQKADSTMAPLPPEPPKPPDTNPLSFATAFLFKPEFRDVLPISDDEQEPKSWNSVLTDPDEFSLPTDPIDVCSPEMFVIHDTPPNTQVPIAASEPEVLTSQAEWPRRLAVISPRELPDKFAVPPPAPPPKPPDRCLSTAFDATKACHMPSSVSQASSMSRSAPPLDSIRCVLPGDCPTNFHAPLLVFGQRTNRVAPLSSRPAPFDQKRVSTDESRPFLVGSIRVNHVQPTAVRHVSLFLLDAPVTILAIPSIRRCDAHLLPPISVDSKRTWDSLAVPFYPPLDHQLFPEMKSQTFIRNAGPLSCLEVTNFCDVAPFDSRTPPKIQPHLISSAVSHAFSTTLTITLATDSRVVLPCFSARAPLLHQLFLTLINELLSLFSISHAVIDSQAFQIYYPSLQSAIQASPFCVLQAIGPDSPLSYDFSGPNNSLENTPFGSPQESYKYIGQNVGIIFLRVQPIYPEVQILVLAFGPTANHDASSMHSIIEKSDGTFSFFDTEVELFKQWDPGRKKKLFYGQIFTTLRTRLVFMGYGMLGTTLWASRVIGLIAREALLVNKYLSFRIF